jgi:hypothetical protein
MLQKIAKENDSQSLLFLFVVNFKFDTLLNNSRHLASKTRLRGYHPN